MFEDSTFESTRRIHTRSRRWMIATFAFNAADSAGADSHSTLLPGSADGQGHDMADHGAADSAGAANTCCQAGARPNGAIRDAGKHGYCASNHSYSHLGA